MVFATETLALGVNLPARSVVIDKLTKFTGETHEQLTPAQFTQLTGRAGRRGIDERGHAIVPWSPFTRFESVAGLASSRSFRLRSAFRPTYNMAVNLLQKHTAESARALLARSFAQYQADVGVARLEQRLARERRKVTELEAVVAELPPEPEARPADQAGVISDAVSQLRPGDLITDEDDVRLAVLGVSWRKGGRARLRLVDESAREARWDLADLEFAPRTIGRIELPSRWRPNGWTTARTSPPVSIDPARARPLGPSAAATSDETTRERSSTEHGRKSGTSNGEPDATPPRSPANSTRSGTCSANGAISTTGPSPNPGSCWRRSTTRSIC